MQMQRPSNKTIIVGGIALVVIGALAVLAFWFTSPRRTLDAVMAAMEDGDQEKVMSFVSQDIKESKRENIEWFVADWVSAESLEWTTEKDESWRSRVDGTNPDGSEKRTIKPTPNYFAHHYAAYVDVTFDEFEDPVIIKLKRRTGNTWSLVSQFFRGWQVVQIRYQPFDESDFEDFEFELEGEEGDLEAGDGSEDGDAEGDGTTTEEPTTGEDAE